MTDRVIVLTHRLSDNGVEQGRISRQGRVGDSRNHGVVCPDMAAAAAASTTIARLVVIVHLGW